MVACETCEEWFHPKCVFDDTCAISLTRGQWKDKHVVCNDAVLSRKIDITKVYRHHNVEMKRNHIEKRMLQQAWKSERCDSSHDCCNKPTGDIAYENLAENDDIFSDWRNITTEQRHYKEDTDAFVKCLDAVSSKAKKKLCSEANEKCTVWHRWWRTRRDKSWHPKKNTSHGRSKRSSAVANANEQVQSYNFEQQSPAALSSDHVNSLNSPLPPAPSGFLNCNDDWISSESIADLRKVTADKSKTFGLIKTYNRNMKSDIPLQKWKLMVENRKAHSFSSNMYKEVLLQIVRKAYSDCFPCVRYHYLRHPDSTTLISLSDEFFYKGHVQMYYRHKNCCGYSCNVKIELVSFSYHVKARQISGTRHHKHQCSLLVADQWLALFEKTFVKS